MKIETKEDQFAVTLELKRTHQRVLDASPNFHGVVVAPFASVHNTDSHQSEIRVRKVQICLDIVQC